MGFTLGKVQIEHPTYGAIDGGFSLFLVLVKQQGGFEVPGEEAEDAEDDGAAEEVPYDPGVGEL